MGAIIQLDSLKIDAVDYASRGNGILGIRDSGKTYTATYFAEQLFRCDIPFLTFDPTGVWKFLRVPGHGKAIPVVVAGGRDGDLPLTPASAPAIVEAAMKGRVSLILDMTSQDLSKADWRRIVLASITVLMQKNFDHGLRHIFIEEAAEFVPQRPLDGQTFAKVEQLVRVGGNNRLGVTLINQRAEELAKSVLELCDNLFLHRQKGKNSLASLQKWLTIGEVQDAKEIIGTLSTLPTGVCYAWLGEEAKAVRCKVPVKNSMHPDRRALIGAVTAGETKPRIDVGAFVEKMAADLAKVKKEADANDPAKLKARIKELEKAAAITLPTPSGTDVKAMEIARAISKEEGYTAGYRAGWQSAWSAALESIGAKIDDAAAHVARLVRRGGPHDGFDIQRVIVPIPKMIASASDKAFRHTMKNAGPLQINHVSRKPTPAAPSNGAAVEGLHRPGSPTDRILLSIAWWNAAGIEEPTRVQVAFVARYKPNTGSFNTYVSKAKGAGLIDIGAAGTLRLTEDGLMHVPEIPPPTGDELIERIKAVLDGPGNRLFDVLLQAPHGEAVSRSDIAERAGYQPNTGSVNTYFSKLNSTGLVTIPTKGFLALADWVRQ